MSLAFFISFLLRRLALVVHGRQLCTQQMCNKRGIGAKLSGRAAWHKSFSSYTFSSYRTHDREQHALTFISFFFHNFKAVSFGAFYLSLYKLYFSFIIIQVLKEIRKLCGTMAVMRFVADFERALWKAIRELFNVPVHGCAYHWGKAIWTRICDVGLKVGLIHSELYFLK